MPIVEHWYRDGLLGLARGEGQRPARRRVVRPGRGRAVRGRIVHRHRARRRPAESDREGERRVRRFLHLRIRDAEPGRTLNLRREAGGERAPIVGAHRPCFSAGRRWRQRHRDRLVRGGLDLDPPVVEPSVFSAQLPHRPSARPEQRPDLALRALRHRCAEGELDPELGVPIMLGRHRHEARCEPLWRLWAL